MLLVCLNMATGSDMRNDPIIMRPNFYRSRTAVGTIGWSSHFITGSTHSICSAAAAVRSCGPFPKLLSQNWARLVRKQNCSYLSCQPLFVCSTATIILLSHYFFKYCSSAFQVEFWVSLMQTGFISKPHPFHLLLFLLRFLEIKCTCFRLSFLLTKTKTTTQNDPMRRPFPLPTLRASYMSKVSPANWQACITRETAMCRVLVFSSARPYSATRNGDQTWRLSLLHNSLAC